VAVVVDSVVEDSEVAAFEEVDSVVVAEAFE
jgi:hypothetical protein